MTTYYLAIDIGASSGRHVIGWIEDGKICMEEIYRFDNLQKRIDGHDCWDVDGLFAHILEGLAACKEKGKVPTMLGIDTWAVDFVLLDKDGKRTTDAVAYRDDRTQGITSLVDQVISPSKIYRKTGIQRQSFNTLFQLVALKREHPEQIEAAQYFLMIPEYFNYLLTGVMKNEYTNATTTNFLNARTHQWDEEILDACDIPSHLFGEVCMPGESVGMLTPEIAERVGFNCEVILPATHDTGSAFLAVPAEDENAVYLSSGTWSLLGVENQGPITSEASRLQNFTNEGGYDYRFRFLKNIMGLWMIQSIRRELNGISYVSEEGEAGAVRGENEIGFGDLIEMAQQATDEGAQINVNDDRFLAPDSMIGEITQVCRDMGQAVPVTTGEVMQCVYSSLSQCYADSIADLSSLTGRDYTSLNIVGGGCQDGYLNQLTADACGIPVLAGPIEGTSLGNLIVQFIKAGEFEDLKAARASIKDSFEIKTIYPNC